MRQLANAATWRPPTKPGAAGQFAVALGVGAAALVLSQYLAAYLFLWSIHADPLSATPLTIARYAYYFGDRDDVSLRLERLAGGIAEVGQRVLPRGV